MNTFNDGMCGPMKNHLYRRLFMLLVLAMLPGLAGAQEYRSPLAVLGDASGTVLYVAEHTANAVAVVDLASNQVTRRIALPLPPGGLALSADAATLYVTGAASEGVLYVVDAASGAMTAQVAVGHTPGAVVLSATGDQAYVANLYNNDVAVVDTASNTVVKRIPVRREPSALALAAGGSLLYVANQLPSGASDGDYISAVVSVIDTTTLEPVAEIALPNGCTALRGICASPDGAHVYVAHILGRYHLPTTQLERGWMNTNALSILDAGEKRLVNTVLLDDVDMGAANPWAPACTPDSRFLCVTHAGTHEISLIDRPALHERLAALDEKAAGAVPNNLAFLVGLRTRVKLPGNGARGLWVNNATAYAAQYFDDSIAAVPIEATGRRDIARIALADTEIPLTEERKGEMLFNNADLCFQHWQSCGSCHPDARVDALNWDLMNDGIGNPKNTRSMLLSHQTPPVMSLGVRDKAETAVRSGIRYIQFAVRPEEDALAIDAYLKSMKPVPSPFLEGGAMSATALRGKEIFSQAGCAACHPEPLYTDLKLHELGFARGMDEGKSVDTPTLVEIWRTAPYLHDGRAATLRDMLTVHNPDNRHGNTSGLDEQALEELIAYLLSL